MQVISRAEAKSKGLTRYFTGNTCPKGHTAPRIVSNGTCLTCKRIRSLKWKKEHPTANTQHSLKYQHNNADKVKARWQRWAASRRAELAAKERMRWREGPTNPTGELQWLNKAKAVNRALKRLLKSSNPDLSLLQKLGSGL